MIGIFDPRVFTVTCCYCKQGPDGHRRDNGECHVFARAEVRPYKLVRRVTAPAPVKGWSVR